MQNAHVHPLIAAVMDTFITQPIAARIEFRDAYVKGLRSHDWEFEHSSDHRKWRAGSEHITNLRAAQPTVDPDGAIWDSIAPPAHRLNLKAPEDTRFMPLGG